MKGTFFNFGIIRTMNESRLKKIYQTRMVKSLSGKPQFLQAPNAGLPFWLENQALGSKKGVQGAD